MKGFCKFAFLVFTFAFTLLAATRVEVSVPEVSYLQVKGDRLYLLSYKESRIYIVNFSGKIEKEFGRKGRGPGEFLKAVRFYIKDSRIWVNDRLNMRVQVFDLEGNFLRTVKFSRMPGARIYPVAEGIFFTSSAFGKGGVAKFTLYLKGGKEERPLISTETKLFSEKVYWFPPESYPLLVGAGDRVFLVDVGDGGVYVFRADGKQERRFATGLPRHKITEAWKKKYLGESKRLVEMLKSRGVKIKFRKEFPAVSGAYGFGKCLVLKEWKTSPPYIYHIYKYTGERVGELKWKKEIFVFSYPYIVEKEERGNFTVLTLYQKEIKDCAWSNN